MSAALPQSLSEAIASIYDCALDAARWPQTLERIAGLIGAVHGAVRVMEPRTRSLRLNTTWGGNEHWTRLYNETYYALVPTLADQIEMQVDRTYHTNDMMPLDRFRASRFYREWARPQGFEDVAGTLFIKQPDRVAWSSYYFPRPIDPAFREVADTLSLLGPHMRRAALISDLLEMRSIEAGQFNAVVDELAIGVILVDPVCRIVHANRAGLAMIESSPLLGSSRGRLSIGHAPTDAALRKLVARLGAAPASGGSAGISVPLLHAELRPALMHVLPLHTGGSRPTIARGASAALFIAPRSAIPATAQEAVAALYDLSPAEMRVLALLLQGRSPHQIGRALALGEPTVRTHLRALFAKTGTARQGELIALVKDLALPVLD